MQRDQPRAELVSLHLMPKIWFLKLDERVVSSQESAHILINYQRFILKDWLPSSRKVQVRLQMLKLAFIEYYIVRPAGIFLGDVLNTFPRILSIQPIALDMISCFS